MITKVELTMEQLGQLDDGKIPLMVAKELQRCVADLNNRPAEQKARKLKIEMQFVPVAGELGDCEAVKFQCKVNSSVPDRQTTQYNLGVTRGNQVYFHVDDEDDSVVN